MEGSGNGLLPVRLQVVCWTIDDNDKIGLVVLMSQINKYFQANFCDNGWGFPLDECHRILLMMSKHWFKQWLDADRQQVIAWANVNQDLWCHLGHNELVHDRMLSVALGQLMAWCLAWWHLVISCLNGVSFVHGKCNHIFFKLYLPLLVPLEFRYGWAITYHCFMWMWLLIHTLILV